MKFNETLIKCVRNDLSDNALVPMLLGEPGIGKSSWVEALAESMHTKCFVLACNQLADKADLTGARLVPVTDDSGKTISYKQVFYPHVVIHEAIEYAKNNPRETPILFLDEINRTTPDVTSAALSIPTLRSIGSYKLPDNLRVVGAGNDKGNVTSLDLASLSRFALYRVEPDTNTFLDIDPDLNIFIRKVLTEHPECIFAKSTSVTNAIGSEKNKSNDDDDSDYVVEEILDDEVMLQITTPRTIAGLSKWLNMFDNRELMELLADTRMIDDYEISALEEAIEGHVGATPFASHLIHEIATNVMNVNSQSNSFKVAKPACYDEIKKFDSRTSLSEYVEEMSDREKSGCLVYALYENEPNDTIIEILSGSINSLESEDMKSLMTLTANDKLDRFNVDAMLKTDTPLSKKLAIILEN